jgi:hypothetical protein
MEKIRITESQLRKLVKQIINEDVNRKEQLSKKYNQLNKKYMKVFKEMEKVDYTWEYEKELDRIQDEMTKIATELENL